MTQQIVQDAFSFQDVLNMIEEGVTKSRRSPGYSREIGTFLTRMNISQSACNNMFEENKEFERAYLRKWKKSTTKKASKVVFSTNASDTPVFNGNINTTPPVGDFQEEEEDFVAEAEVEEVREDGLA